ncbi:MAG: 16S rRNA (cytosine(1402)-N(4))-methyltransferase RsmH [Flavobacteriales bacterium]|jgi:16S rRNA (cytosine1402-N4)-methyltransferase|nr:16S rRNA (cytosine(1402)-N(4))-methyltransferase RsmH [Flavobacteriales bacterium]
MTTGSDYHDPVLSQACIDGLNIRPDGIYVDATFGGGGHSRAILGKLGPQGRLIAFDRDKDAWANAINDPRFTLVKSDFRWIRNHLRFLQAIPINGLLADLGVSSHQFDRGERGFSIRFDGPLDMRMDRRAKLTAADIVNGWDEGRIAGLLRSYGEVDGAHRVARALANARAAKRITTTQQLIQAIAPVTPWKEENGFRAQVFQALRIAVNDELGSLEALLKQSAEVMAPGARLVVISYHSLEDRLVKNWMRAGHLSGEEQKDHYGNRLRPFHPSGKAIKPSEEETARNPRARSARLRIAERA